MDNCACCHIYNLCILGIEEIGVEIEDPFGTDPNDLPINDITTALENGIEELKKLEVN